MSWENDTAVVEFILLGLSKHRQTQMILCVMFFHVCLISVSGNVLIIMVFLTTRRLQTPMYFFLVNLSFMDICLSLTIVPKTLKDLISETYIISYAGCVTQMYISLSIGECEAFLLAFMAYDRYVAICYPLHYTTIINRSVYIKMGAIAWMCGFLFSIPIVALTFNVDLCGHNQINHFFCEQPEILSLGCGNIIIIETVSFVSCTIVLLIPITLICVSYFKIIKAILKLRSSAGPQRAFSTCGSHLVVVTLFYGSGVAAYMKPRSSASTDFDKVMAVFYSSITPMLNPLIYTLRNNEVKTVLRTVATKHLLTVILTTSKKVIE